MNEWQWVDPVEDDEKPYLTSMRTGCVVALRLPQPCWAVSGVFTAAQSPWPWSLLGLVGVNTPA